MCAAVTPRDRHDGSSRRKVDLTLIDCDVHHAIASPKDLYPYLPGATPSGSTAS